jgi:hypothetical protein
MDEAVHVPRLFLGHVLRNVKAFDFAGELARKGAGIKGRDLVNPGLPSQQIAPRLGNRIAYWADTAQTSDNNATTRHMKISVDPGPFPGKRMRAKSVFQRNQSRT